MIDQEIEPLNSMTSSPPRYEDPRILLRVLINELATQLANVTVSKILGDVSIGNLDEVSAALHNEISKLTKVLTTRIQAVEEAISKPEPEDKEEKKFRKDLLEKITDKIEVKNFPKITIPEEVSVKNLEILKPLFEDLRDSLSEVIRGSLSINIPEPKVIVNPPEVRLPPSAPIVFPEINIQAIIKSLESNLNKIRTNDEKRPLAVRLTDGQNWIKQLQTIADQQKIYFDGSPNYSPFLREIAGNTSPRGIVPFEYDYIELSYTGSNPTGIIYKKSGVTVATLTLAFSGSDLTSVTRT